VQCNDHFSVLSRDLYMNAATSRVGVRATALPGSHPVLPSPAPPQLLEDSDTKNASLHAKDDEVVVMVPMESKPLMTVTF